ncbi:hypothetical protein PAUR_a3226 [Pseudoalteromonas aurantia 208]|uniref:Uncharacterized protein n=1 Tax=Pseudoalteromonas aurantia 208 TaxID=1314867 RepID=A0ABR9E5N5_9GAMM|nr:hypothetical protein [Pseudoalteromonas aurantia 208]
MGGSKGGSSGNLKLLAGGLVELGSIFGSGLLVFVRAVNTA